MNSRSLERIRKRREEDEDDMIFFIWPTLYQNLSRIDKKQRHSSVLYGKRRVNEILQGHVKNCLVAFRMEPHIFKVLASYLRRENLMKDKTIKVEEKLAFFLYMLSHNASFQDLQLEYQHSGWTFHEYIKSFFDIVPTLSCRFLKHQSIDEPHPKIAGDPRFFPYFEVFTSTLSLLVLSISSDFGY